jgi:hypothetical protein
MAEIGDPVRRRVLIPQTVPTENPYADPRRVRPPEKEPVLVPERTHGTSHSFTLGCAWRRTLEAL